MYDLDLRLAAEHERLWRQQRRERLSIKDLDPKEALELCEAKIEEHDRNLYELNKRRRELYTRMVNASERDAIVLGLMLETVELEIHRDETRRRSWAFKHKLVQGEAKEAPADLEAIKEVPLDRLMSANWTNCGSRRKCRCPIHNEKTASFVWYVDQNRWHCFGCGRGGSNIDLWMFIHNLDLKSAILELRNYI